ncbi:hypothetical protein CEXT_41111 [Caerostris extrusa]|uniref:Uncharacterized protein n=1 Tax=Caerostris extrusa TaxID=172846 RepID=A0AAV4QA64_CAEEX|nr:hypothetical protein CEXT_41111 [Caerostris extrusa]
MAWLLQYGIVKTNTSSVRQCQNKEFCSVTMPKQGILQYGSVAAWAVSADVVMSSGSRQSKSDSHLLQNFDNRRDIFRENDENLRPPPQPQSSAKTTTSTQKTTTTSTTTVPPTLSPQEETDVNAIISKLISASGAANGGSGPRFVVVAPLPDNPESISRVDNSPPTQPNSPSAKHHSRDDSSWQVSAQRRPEPEVISAASSKNFQVVHPPMARSAGNLTNRMGAHSGDGSNRRIGLKPMIMGNGHNNPGNGFHNAQIEMTGFEPFDTMMHDFQASASSAQKQQQNPPANFGGSFNNKRGPPQGHFNGRNQHMPHMGMKQDQHIFHHHMPDLNPHGMQGSANHPPGMMAPPPSGIGLKPIQQQLHHIDPLRTEESKKRWGNVGFHGSPYHHKTSRGNFSGHQFTSEQRHTRVCRTCKCHQEFLPAILAET